MNNRTSEWTSNVGFEVHYRYSDLALDSSVGGTSRQVPDREFVPTAALCPELRPEADRAKARQAESISL